MAVWAAIGITDAAYPTPSAAFSAVRRLAPASVAAPGSSASKSLFWSRFSMAASLGI